MRWSDRTLPGPFAYGLAALLAIGELLVLWLALHPRVPEDYRAYYIDHTTTCLPQPVSGDYELGTEIDFRSGGPDTRQLRPCGWEGPAGDGMHALGEQSRLRFAVGTARPLTLMLELTGVTLPGPAAQRVDISVNGTTLGEIEVPAGETRRFTLPVPEAALAGRTTADIALNFPDAILARPGDSNTRKRSVKLVGARLAAAR